MGVLDRGYFDIRILEDEPWSDIMTKENFRQRYCASTVADPDLGADGEILDRGLDQLVGSRWTIDIDRTCSVLIPRNRHQSAKTCGVIVVQMGQENRPD